MSDDPLAERTPDGERPPELSEELRRLGVHLGVTELKTTARGRTHERPAIESVVPGQVLETPYGSCFLVETSYPLEHVHGSYALGALAEDEQPAPLLARLLGDDSLADMAFSSAIFFDIETTGLGIGSGMYAFMVGFGVFEDDQFVLRQYFMRDYHEEAALLYAVAQQMERFSWWVSFNGRNFDLPVLQTRFVCAGYGELPLMQAPHLDLLYPSRRIWRRRLTSCALSSLENNVLGLVRTSDVPGWMIPGLYFDYLRYGDVSPLRQVFEHNAMDILSLVTLASRINHMLQDGPDAHAIDRYSLATMYESLGLRRQAQLAYEQALQDRLPSELQADAMRRLSFVYKRTGQIEHAVRIWQALQQENRTYAIVELAKYYEHQKRDYLHAAKLVREALSLQNLPDGGPCARAELIHRLARLKQSLGGGGLVMPHIESYSFGRIVVDGTTYTADLIVLPDGVRAGWWRQQGHSLQKSDLDDVVQAQPSALVIGTGNLGRMQVPKDTLDYLASLGIKTIVAPTAEACERYNELAQKEQAAAALHLTC